MVEPVVVGDVACIVASLGLALLFRQLIFRPLPPPQRIEQLWIYGPKGEYDDIRAVTVRRVVVGRHDAGEVCVARRASIDEEREDLASLLAGAHAEPQCTVVEGLVYEVLPLQSVVLNDLDGRKRRLDLREPPASGDHRPQERRLGGLEVRSRCRMSHGTRGGGIEADQTEDDGGCKQRTPSSPRPPHQG